MFKHIEDSGIAHLPKDICPGQGTLIGFILYLLFCEVPVEAFVAVFLYSHHQEKTPYRLCAIHFWIQAVFILAQWSRPMPVWGLKEAESKKFI